MRVQVIADRVPTSRRMKLGDWEVEIESDPGYAVFISFRHIDSVQFSLRFSREQWDEFGGLCQFESEEKALARALIQKLQTAYQLGE